jgi:DNA invertase Pin-like site-specific DNA recombinase
MRHFFARVSTKDKGQDVRNQLGQLRAYCDKQGWKMAGEYIDERGGKNGDRVEFQRMMANAYQREFDVVLFLSLDRFSREGVVETLQYLKPAVILRRCVQIVHRAMPRWHRHLQGRHHRVRLSERITASLERARKKGRVDGRPRKNYKHDADAKRIRQFSTQQQWITCDT